MINSEFYVKNNKERLKHFLRDLPNLPGVYFYKDGKNEIIYIGKAKNLRKRIFSYFRDNNSIKTLVLLQNIKYIDYMLTKDEKEALLWENTLIKRFMPKFNISLKDDKTYPYLKITNEKYPRIYITRKVEDDGGKYFGPYVDVGILKDILNIIKKIFNIRKCKKSLKNKEKRPCLNYFMNRCLAPCYYDVDEKTYKEMISDIKSFINFDYKKLLKKWLEDIKIFIKNMEFEKAEILKNKIFALEKIKNKSFDIKIWQITEKDITKIQEIYNQKEEELASLENIFNLDKKVRVIAGFDISNISGKFAVGSRVVFVDGKPCKEKYRHYKIKTVPNEPNDFAMMKEVIERTLNGDDIDDIDLLLIDGGKGQLSSAMEIKEKLHKNIPIISIAKKEEIIFLENQKVPIRLDMHSNILKLIRYIRDEAHRFAVSYHTKLRNKGMIES